jgi:hypothetical protein
MPEHMRARTGWRDDIPACFFKDADRMLGNRTRFGAQTRVEVRLSAAGLVGREVHVNAEAVQNVHDRLARLRVEGIDQARDKKLDGGHEFILSLKRKQVDKYTGKKKVLVTCVLVYLSTCVPAYLSTSTQNLVSLPLYEHI